MFREGYCSQVVFREVFFVNKGLTSFCSSSILFTTESELAVFCLLPWAWLAGQSVFEKSFLQDVRHNLQE